MSNRYTTEGGETKEQGTAGQWIGRTWTFDGTRLYAIWQQSEDSDDLHAVERPRVSA